jgi:hypothetical protein
MDAEEKRRKHAEYMRRWRERNPQNGEYQRQYNERYSESSENREKARRRSRLWYAANRQRALKTARERYAVSQDRKSAPPHKYKGAGYYALHRWVAAEKGRPSKCEHCGTETAKRFEWANVDHSYRAVLGDWIRLCKSCHVRYDLANGLVKAGGRPRKRQADR